MIALEDQSNIRNLNIPFIICCYCMRGADKSLARPGRKQASVTKLGIYSTYSQQSSVHFLAHCSVFCKPLKKNSEGCLSNRVCSSNDLHVGRKMVTYQLFFQSREQVVVRWGQIRRIGWVIKTLEAQVGQFLLSCNCPVIRDIVVQEQDPLVDLPRRLSFKMSFTFTCRDE